MSTPAPGEHRGEQPEDHPGEPTPAVGGRESSARGVGSLAAGVAVAAAAVVLGTALFFVVTPAEHFATGIGVVAAVVAAAALTFWWRGAARSRRHRGNATPSPLNSTNASQQTDEEGTAR
ncbi:hypothetical protein [Amycolatopsis sp. cg9]|uniref:hypothetical protein n=1 Tax=Amycolatopsis sp. cg9 TaxID=3238801 RepID=UPI003523BE4D